MDETLKQMYEMSKEDMDACANYLMLGGGTRGGPVLKHGKGVRVWDIDDNEYIDYISSWGPMILGHAHPSVIKAIKDKVEYSTSFGAPTQLEIEIAKLIVDMVPNIDKVRMVNSGTEACMSAIRVARGYTGKNKFIKFLSFTNRLSN